MNHPSVTGTVHLIEPTKTFGQKGFRKRLVVLEQSGGRFTNYLPLEFIQDGCDSVDELNVGDEITVTYRLTGRKWQKDERSEVKFFLSAEALEFQRAGGRPAPAASQPGDDVFDSYPENEDAPF
ncbi:MAG: DUF3127 domain-containing protein [Planctomycetaceae bacterium]|nr:DUF3127 domain-containing protein [Planctomycetaceae bacterium]